MQISVERTLERCDLESLKPGLGFRFEPVLAMVPNAILCRMSGKKHENKRENKVAVTNGSGMLRPLSEATGTPAGIERLTVLNILHRVGAGGHNNTKVNPVFRGMVRFRQC